MQTDFEGNESEIVADLQRSITLDEIEANPLDPTIPHILLSDAGHRGQSRRQARQLRCRRRALYRAWIDALGRRTATGDGARPVRRLQRLGWLERWGLVRNPAEEAVQLVRQLARAGGAPLAPAASPADQAGAEAQPEFVRHLREALATGDRHTYFRMLRKLNARGRRVLRHQRLKARSCSLEICIREELEFIYLTRRLWLCGVLHFAGISNSGALLRSAARAAQLASASDSPS